jgi:hypothetical protein
MSSVWVFVAEGANLPSGLFQNQKTALGWIERYSLSGVLTEYPLDIGIYDWAINNGFFEPKYPSQEEPAFIGRFTSAYLRHSHFENGKDVEEKNCYASHNGAGDESFPLSLGRIRSFVEGSRSRLRGSCSCFLLLPKESGACPP